MAGGAVAERAPRSTAGDPTSDYRELPAPPGLAYLLVCTWVQTVSDGAHHYQHRVLPDGCADILWAGSAAPVLVGPAPQHVIAPLPPRTTIVGVRFRPGRLPDALGVPATEVLDREVPLRDVWTSAADELTGPIAELPTAAEKLAAIARVLRARWSDPTRVDPLAHHAVRWLADRPTSQVRALARELGVGERQLLRRFEAAVGYGPKTFQRIARFQRLLSLGKRGPLGRPGSAHRGLADLALRAGYADQAHMTREVRELSGTTPAALLGRVDSQLSMSDLFKTGPGDRR